MLYIYVGYLLVMNCICFFLMWLDKKYSKRHHERIPEQILFGFGILGGALGGFLAMQLFHHKTRHTLFSVGLPCIILLHFLLTIFLFNKGVL